MRRQQQVIDPQPLVAVPTARLVIPERVDMRLGVKRPERIGETEMEEAAKNGTLSQYIQEQVSRGQAQAASGGQVLFPQGGPTFVVHNDAAPAEASPAPANVADELKKLADLRDRGALTDAEFEMEKSKLLSAS